MTGDHSVYDGQIFAGSICQDAAGRYSAFDLAGALIGRFETAAAAVHAVLDADRDAVLLALIEHKTGEAAR